jgi:exonuclease SbcC
LIDKYNTNPEVINYIIEILCKANNQILGIIGNHDVYGQNHAVYKKVIIGTLFTSGIIKLLTKVPVFVEAEDVCVQLTGGNYVPDIDKDRTVYQIKRHPEADHAIHVVHGFLVTKHWPTLKRQHYTVLSEVFTEANVVLTGHEHQGFGIVQQDGVLFSNPGALGRISSNLKEINRMPQVTLLNAHKEYVEATLVPVPSMPGNKVLSRKHIEDEKKHKQMLTEFSAGLGDKQEVCDLVDIFNKEATIQEIEQEVRKMSWKAIETYEQKLV